MAILKKTPFNDKKSWIKVLEYAGKGIPAVASNVGQYPEFIEHGVNGYLINDVSELAATLELLTDDQHREKLSLAVFEKALEYSIENQVHRWREVYEGATP
jgi:glycosyltransferase involved in cell wall biosynthesis